MAGIARMRAIVLDCPDPRALAAFYQGLIGWEIDEADEEWVTMSNGGEITLAFQRAPDHRPPRWPDPEYPQQFHIDLTVDDADKAEELALARGAVKADVQPGEADGDWRVYLDPAGHPFCLCPE